jgi:hypothetical protein
MKMGESWREGQRRERRREREEKNGPTHTNCCVRWAYNHEFPGYNEDKYIN